MEEFGNYFIEHIEHIGNGSFGTVEKIRLWNRSKTHSTELARKFFSPRITDEEYADYRQRFDIEVKSQSGCLHRNIVHICAHNLHGNKPWFLMELGNTSLENVLASNDCKEGDKKLTKEQKINILLMILNGVDFMHKNNLIHRDLKPLNIIQFIDKKTNEFIYKITDFGLVKNLNRFKALTRIGQQLGSDRYMAPEIQQGGEYSQKSDIYAIGVIIEDLQLDEPLAHIHQKCTQRKPTARYSSVNDIINDLHSYNEAYK